MKMILYSEYGVRRIQTTVEKDNADAIPIERSPI